MSVCDKLGKRRRRRGKEREEEEEEEEEEEDMQTEDIFGGVGGFKMQLTIVLSWSFAMVCAQERGWKGKGSLKLWQRSWEGGGIMAMHERIRRSW